MKNVLLQNPWLECDVGISDIKVARRQSGGGAVYQVSSIHTLLTNYVASYNSHSHVQSNCHCH